MKKILLTIFMIFSVVVLFAGPHTVSITTPKSGPSTLYTGGFVADELYIDSDTSTSVPISIKDGSTVKRYIIPSSERRIPLYGQVFSTSVIVDFGTATGTATINGRKK